MSCTISQPSSDPVVRSVRSTSEEGESQVWFAVAIGVTGSDAVAIRRGGDHLTHNQLAGTVIQEHGRGSRSAHPIEARSYIDVSVGIEVAQGNVSGGGVRRGYADGYRAPEIARSVIH